MADEWDQTERRDMKLIPALVACLFLYRTLVGLFDLTQAASKAGAAASENTIDMWKL